MKSLILINSLCSISLIIACFFNLTRTRFNAEVLNYFNHTQLKYMSIIGISVAYSMFVYNYHIWGREIILSWLWLYLIMTLGYIIGNIVVWKIIIHHIKFKHHDRQKKEKKETNPRTSAQSVSV